MTPEDLIRRLAAEVPEFEIDPFDLPDEDDDALLTYSIVADLAVWLADDSTAEEPRARALALIEDGFLRGDDEVRNLLAVELFEGFPWPPGVLAAMGPKTRHEHEIFGLAEDADAGRLSSEQIEDVARLLRRGRSLEPHLDVRAALYVLAAARAKEHRGLVVSYLGDPDPRIAIEALRVLCIYWDDTDVHADAVIATMRDAMGDGDDVVATRREAAFIAGRHLRGRRHPALLAELIRLVEDAGEHEAVRAAAYHALGQSSTREPPLFEGPDRLPPALDEQRMARARALLAGDAGG